MGCYRILVTYQDTIDNTHIFDKYVLCQKAQCWKQLKTA